MRKEEVKNGTGFRVYDDNNVLIGYEADNSCEGCIFKDADAYEKSEDEICYISEHAFDDCDDWFMPVEMAKEEGETKRTIREKVREEFGDDYCLTEEQVNYIADDAFEIADWAYIETYLVENESLEDMITYDTKGIFTAKQKEAVDCGALPRELK